jgi:predicted Zn-ribbon and HTH transcriptional regulator
VLYLDGFDTRATPFDPSIRDVVDWFAENILVRSAAKAAQHGWQVMARISITVMGFRCDRCGHEWIPRGGLDEEPRVCPKCHSAWWNQPSKKARMSYDDFKMKVADALRNGGKPLTWTEVRTLASLPQTSPNNQWVQRMETDIGLRRRCGPDGIIYWQLSNEPHIADPATPTTKAPSKVRSHRKQSALE